MWHGRHDSRQDADCSMLAGLSPGLSDGAALHCSDTILNEFCQAGELAD